MPSSPSARSGKPRSGASRSTRGAVLPLVPGFGRPPVPRRPLPDATAVRLLPVPDSAPPYDDEVTDGERAAPRPQRLTLVPPAPRAPATQDGRPAAAPGHGRERVREESRRAPGRPGPPSPQRRPGAETGWPSQFAQVLAETLAGARNQRQIVPWTTDQARRRIRQLGPMLAAGTAPRVHRIMTSRPTESAVEMTVVVGFGSRVRALAVRLERDGPHQASPGRDARAARWVCTVIEAA
ncbi:MAG TPA: Rv3235 family protein [Streptosporangiaceae bacterium]